MEYLKDSFDTGQTEKGFFNSKSAKGYRSSYSLHDPEHHECSYNLLTQWDGGKPLQPPLFWKESASELSAKKLTKHNKSHNFTQKRRFPNRPRTDLQL